MTSGYNTAPATRVPCPPSFTSSTVLGLSGIKLKDSALTMAEDKYLCCSCIPLSITQTIGSDSDGGIIFTSSAKSVQLDTETPILISSLSDTSKMYGKFITRSSKHFPLIFNLAEKLSGKTDISEVPSDISIISP